MRNYKGIERAAILEEETGLAVANRKRQEN